MPTLGRLEWSIAFARSALNRTAPPELETVPGTPIVNGQSDLAQTDTQVAFGPRSYVALVERPPQVEYGLEPVTEDPETVHIVYGEW